MKKKKKNAPKFTLIYVSLQTMQKTAFFVCLFVFLLWHQPARREKMIYKTFKDTFAASVITHRHTEHVHTYIQSVGFSLEPANEALQPVQNGARTRSHTLFGEYMDIKENTTHEAYHRKEARL